jgi:hypothetical protein
VLGSGGSHDSSYFNPATINIPINTSVDLPFTYSASNITVRYGSSDSKLITVAESTKQQVCVSVDVE